MLDESHCACASSGGHECQEGATLAVHENVRACHVSRLCSTASTRRHWCDTYFAIPHGHTPEFYGSYHLCCCSCDTMGTHLVPVLRRPHRWRHQMPPHARCPGSLPQLSWAVPKTPGFSGRMTADLADHSPLPALLGPQLLEPCWLLVCHRYCRCRCCYSRQSWSCCWESPQAHCMRCWVGCLRLQWVEGPCPCRSQQAAAGSCVAQAGVLLQGPMWAATASRLAANCLVWPETLTAGRLGLRPLAPVVCMYSGLTRGSGSVKSRLR